MRKFLEERSKIAGLKREKLLLIVAIIFISVGIITVGTGIILRTAGVKIRHAFYDRLFSDFAETLAYCIKKDPYKKSPAVAGGPDIYTSYTPLGFLIAAPFLLICRKTVEGYASGKFTLNTVYRQPDFIAAYVLYALIFAALAAFALVKLSKFKGKELAFLICSVFFGAPFLFCIVRGNTVLAAFVFVLLAFACADRERRALRELSPLFLAIAAAIKVYPALAAIFYLKEKRYKDFLKCAVYSAALVFIPFIFYGGGAIKSMFGGSLTFMNSRTGEGANVSVGRLIFGAADLIQDGTGKDLHKAFSAISIAARFTFIFYVACLAVLSKKGEGRRWEWLMLIMCTLLAFNETAYYYTLIFFAVPAVYLLKDWESVKNRDMFTLFSLVLIAFPFVFLFGNFYVQSFAVALMAIWMAVWLSIETFGNMRKRIRERKIAEQKTEEKNEGSEELFK